MYLRTLETFFFTDTPLETSKELQVLFPGTRRIWERISWRTGHGDGDPQRLVHADPGRLIAAPQNEVMKYGKWKSSSPHPYIMPISSYIMFAVFLGFSLLLPLRNHCLRVMSFTSYFLGKEPDSGGAGNTTTSPVMVRGIIQKMLIYVCDVLMFSLGISMNVPHMGLVRGESSMNGVESGTTKNPMVKIIAIGSMVLLYMVCHGSHQYTPVMLAYIPAPWILWFIIATWVCLKIVYPIVPNGFADHYPY